MMAVSDQVVRSEDGRVGGKGGTERREYSHVSGIGVWQMSRTGLAFLNSNTSTSSIAFPR